MIMTILVREHLFRNYWSFLNLEHSDRSTWVKVLKHDLCGLSLRAAQCLPRQPIPQEWEDDGFAKYNLYRHASGRSILHAGTHEWGS